MELLCIVSTMSNNRKWKKLRKGRVRWDCIKNRSRKLRWLVHSFHHTKDSKSFRVLQRFALRLLQQIISRPAPSDQLSMDFFIGLVGVLGLLASLAYFISTKNSSMEIQAAGQFNKEEKRNRADISNEDSTTKYQAAGEFTEEDKMSQANISTEDSTMEIQATVEFPKEENRSRAEISNVDSTMKCQAAGEFPKQDKMSRADISTEESTTKREAAGEFSKEDKRSRANISTDDSTTKRQAAGEFPKEDKMSKANISTEDSTAKFEVPGDFFKKKKRTKASNWIVDSGAKCHVTGDSSLFSGQLDIPPLGSYVCLASGHKLEICGIGTAQFGHFTLRVYYVCGFKKNVISVSKMLAETSGRYTIQFAGDGCYIKDEATEKRIFELQYVDNLYELDYAPCQ